LLLLHLLDVKFELLLNPNVVANVAL
jgi:hypothetical protein